MTVFHTRERVLAFRVPPAKHFLAFLVTPYLKTSYETTLDFSSHSMEVAAVDAAGIGCSLAARFSAQPPPLQS